MMAMGRNDAYNNDVIDGSVAEHAKQRRLLQKFEVEMVLCYKKARGRTHENSF
jgi:hypothetical protein